MTVHRRRDPILFEGKLLTDGHPSATVELWRDVDEIPRVFFPHARAC